MLIIGATIFGVGAGDAWLRMADGRIVELGSGMAPAPAAGEAVLDAAGDVLLPGFIDLHVHGGLGADVMDATPDALAQIARHAAAHGCTGWLPTTLTDSPDRIDAALASIHAAMRVPPADGATILGARLEGPYLNREKAGAQNPEWIRTAEPQEARRWLDLNVIRVLDIAPEIEANRWLIGEAVARGVVVSLAHSAATAGQALAAFTEGVGHSTHTYNAQTPLLHREPGIVGAVLATDSVTAECIADGVHVHPLALRVAWLCKRPDRLMLITDAVRAAGMTDGAYAFDSRAVVLSDGAVRLPDGTLAGSALTMDAALRTLIMATGEPLEQVWQTTSLNAAQRLGLAHRKGRVLVGYDADLVLLDEQVQARATWVGGRLVYSRV